MITTVILDLDNTLYDEIECYKSSFMAVAELAATPPKILYAERIFDCLMKIPASFSWQSVFGTKWL